MRLFIGLLSLVSLVALPACSNGDYSEPPEGASPIPVLGDKETRYYLLEQERGADGRLHAIVLMNLPTGREGPRAGYRIDCGGGPAWITEAVDTLGELRSRPMTQTMRTRSEDGSDEQIVRWLCSS